MATIEYTRIIHKSAPGLPTIPPSAAHDNGDWSMNDIYEFELYIDSDTNLWYSRIGSSIIPLPGLQFVSTDGSLTGLGTPGTPLSVNVSTADGNKISKHISDGGIYSNEDTGTMVTAYTFAVNGADNTKMDFTVSGRFRNPTTGAITEVTNLAFNAQTITHFSTGVTFFGVKEDLTLTQQVGRFTTEQSYNHLCEWAVVYVVATNVIITHNPYPNTTAQLGQQFLNVLRNRGVINYGNNQYTNFGGTTPLNIYKPVGGMVEGAGWGNLDADNPNEKIMAAISSADTFQIRKSTGLHLDAQTVIDPTIYESSAGTVTTVAGATDVTVYEICFFNSNLTRIQLGQRIHASIDDAVAYVLTHTLAERLPFGQETNIANNGIVTTFLAIQKNCTSWAQTTRFRFFANPLTSRSGSSPFVTFNSIYNAVTAPQLTVTDAKGEFIKDSTRALASSKIDAWSYNGVEQANITGEGTYTAKKLIAPNYLPVKRNTPISHTGTIVETVVDTYDLLNLFQASDMFKFNIMTGTHTNNANVKTVRVYVNATANLAGTPVLIATRLVTSAANSGFVRTLAFKGNIAQQQILQTTANVGTDEGATGVSITDLTIDFSTQKYLVITNELANSGDTMGIRYITSKLSR